MHISVIVCTRNRAALIIHGLQSIANAFEHAGINGEIIVADNASTDNTKDVVSSFLSNCKIPVLYLIEPKTGKSRALNLAIASATGDIIVFTDDDCRFKEDYFVDLMRYHNSDTELVMRRGCIADGNPSQYSFNSPVIDKPLRWSRRNNNSRKINIADCAAGANMVLPRKLIETVGLYDTDLGPGSALLGNEDTDYVYRCYLAGAILERVPDMTVYHTSGYNTLEHAYRSFRRGCIGQGALNVKYIFRHFNFCRPTYWDFKNAIKDWRSGTNTYMPAINFSYNDKLRYTIFGACRYIWFKLLASSNFHRGKAATTARPADLHPQADKNTSGAG